MNRPEEQLQRSVAQYLNVAHPRAIWFHVPNQKGSRTKLEASILKGLGVRPGVADLIFCLPGGRFAAMELKAAKGVHSPAQKEFLATVEAAGGVQATVRTLDEAIAYFEAWGLP